MSRKIVVVGGSASGAACAARCRRCDEHAEIVVFEKTDNPSFASCGMPYYIGKTIVSRSDLEVASVGLLSRGFNFDLRLHTEVTEIDRENKTVTAVNLETEESVVESYDTLVLCMGSRPWAPPIPGIAETPNMFKLGSAVDMDAIYAAAERAESCLVLGGGFIGLEVAEQLMERDIEMTIVELLPHVIPPLDLELAQFVEKELTNHGANVLVSSSVKSFEWDEASEKIVCTIETKKRRFTETSVVAVDMVLLSTGVRSCTELPRAAGLDLTNRGLVIVNEHLQTSDPAIYACGELIETTNLMTQRKGFVPLANVANIHGRVAANHIYGTGPDEYRAATGTAMLKIFDLEVAILGTSEELCKRFEIEYERCLIAENSQVKYMPKKTPPYNLFLKCIFTPDEGKIIGFQAVGLKGGTYALACTMSTAVVGGLSVFDLETLELPYCPFFGGARNPLNNLGMACAGMIRGTHKLLEMGEFLANRARYTLVDIRPARAFARGHIDGSINIPLNDLRDRIGELSKMDHLVFCCNVGKFAYCAARVAEQRGFPNCQALMGGYLLWLRSFA